MCAFNLATVAPSLIRDEGTSYYCSCDWRRWHGKSPVLWTSTVLVMVENTCVPLQLLCM